MVATRPSTPSSAATPRRGRWALSLLLALTACALGGIAVLPAATLAVAPPIALDAPDNGYSPQIAYDPSTQTTYVAWSNPAGTGIDLCIVPAGASACSGGGPVLLTDSHFTGAATPVIGGLLVLPGGEAVVIGATAQGGVGSLAWASPAGGAAFLSGNNGLENGGEPISPVSLYYTTNNAVAINSTDVGIFDSYDHFYSYFSDSPFAGPETPSSLPSNTGNANNGGQFDDQGDTEGPVVAAEPAPAPAPAGTYIVVGAGANVGSNETTPPGCINYAATGYGVDVGTSGHSGTLNSQGLQPKGFGLLACSAEDPTLASGGTDGIGVLEEEGSAISGAGSDWQMDYRPFIATATGGSFGAPVELSDITNEVLDGVDAVDVSDDSGTGVYAFWEDGKGVLDYSPNGGASWGGPVVSPIPYTAHGVIAGIGNGTAEIAYDENPGTGTQVFLQIVNYQELATPVPAADTLTTTQTSGSSTGPSITLPAGTVGETDRATLAGANAASATGTVTYGLFSSSSCAAATKVFAGGTSAVSAGVAAPSAPVTTALAQGTYYWEAAYSGDAHNDASASACGSEVLTVTPATTIGGGGSSTGTSITITITCEVVPCTVTVTITITESGKAAAARKKHHTKTITLATGKFTITSKGTHKLTVHLTKAGKHYLSAHHGRGSAKLLLSDRTNGATFLTTRTLEITPAKHKHKK